MRVGKLTSRYLVRSAVVKPSYYASLIQSSFRVSCGQVLTIPSKRFKRLYLPISFSMGSFGQGPIGTLSITIVSGV